ncbi:MAG: hypothetical protein H7202_09055 [Pedobacter sp.]|nr:hypothetical protein [Pedobacter sp.]
MKLFKNIATALALMIILFAGCKNPAEDVQIIVNTDIFKSPMLLQFVNAKSGAAGPQDFIVEITGPNASLVRTTTGGKVFKAGAGLLNLLLDRNANPTPSSPVKFTVVVNVAGFAPTYQDVVITSATGQRIFKIPMVDYKNPSTNTGVVEATKPVTNGTASTDLVFTTTTNSSMADKSDITVSSGTGLLNAAGQAISANSVDAKIVHFGTAAAGTTQALPGGTFASNVIGANGQPVVAGVNFNPAGAVAIDMFAGTTEVKGFTKPIIIDMEVVATMINPTTNQAIKVNETIPMWSLNEKTGQWKSEGNATFVTNAASKLVARMQITHLSTWMSAYTATSCTTNITINRPSGDSDEQFEITSPSGSVTYITLLKGELAKSAALNSTSNEKGVIKARSLTGNYINNTLSSASYTTLCGQNSAFTFTASPDVINASVYVKFKCSNKDLLTGINAYVTITPVGGSTDDAKIYNLVNGRGTGSVINGVTYNIVASVDGTTYKSQFKADKNNFVLPSGFDLTGTASYNASENMLTIDGVVTKNCN